MRILPSSRQRHRLTAHAGHRHVDRPATTAAMLGRTFCCALALSTPYAMFLLNGVLRP